MAESYVVRPYSFMPALPLAEKWERLKPVIEKLYVDEGHKLDKVIDILREQYGFDASKHQIKYNIRKWKLKKSIPAQKKTKMYRMVESRAAMGKSTLLEYRGKSVGRKKLIRHEKDLAKKRLVRRNMIDPAANTVAKQNLPAIHMATTIFMKWNMPYGALRNAHSGFFGQTSPFLIGPSPMSDIVAITPAAFGIQSPPADSPTRISMAARNKTSMERAHLFMEGKFHALSRTMGREELITTSTWLYQYWQFAFRTAKYWGKGPKNWTKELLGLDRHMEKLSISAAPTPGMLDPSPGRVSTPASTWLMDGLTPSILCHWGVHVPYLYYEPIITRDSDELDDDPCQNMKAWPRSWMKASFTERLFGGLRSNRFTDMDEDNLAIAIPRLIQSSEMETDEFLEDALAFSIMGRNVDALSSVMRRVRRSKRTVNGFHPFHLATSYLSGNDPCCNLLGALLSYPSIFPLKQLYADERGYTVLDNLMLTIFKSHTSCSPSDIDEKTKHGQRFEGEEVDVCGRWDADSDEVCALLARGEPRIPFDWKHKFCHTSVQVICHCINLLFGKATSPDINHPSGLFRKKCQHCRHESKLLPLHVIVVTSIILAEQGCAEEDLFGMVACLLCLLRKGANPSLKAELSVQALLEDSPSTACTHESVDAQQLADRVPASRSQSWSPRIQDGWKLICFILRVASRPQQSRSLQEEVRVGSTHQQGPAFQPSSAWHSFLNLPEQEDISISDGEDADSVDEEVTWCQSCHQPNYFYGCPELRDLWATAQAELLTYRRLRDWHDWQSPNFDIGEIVENLQAGHGLRIGFFEKGLLRDICDCGSFQRAELPDIPCVDEVSREYFSNLEEWERTSYLWCPEEIDEDYDDEIYDLSSDDYEEEDDEEEDDEDEDGEEDYDDGNAEEEDAMDVDVEEVGWRSSHLGR